MSQPRPIIRKISAKYGIYIGIILSILTVVLYSISLDFFLKWWLTFIEILIIAGGCILAMMRCKKRFPLEFSFRNAFTSFFVAVLVGTLIYTGVNFLLFHEIDPQAGHYVTEASIDKLAEQVHRRENVPKEFEQQIAEMRKEDQYGLGNQITGFLFNLVLYSILGILLSFVFRTSTLKRH